MLRVKRSGPKESNLDLTDNTTAIWDSHIIIPQATIPRPPPKPCRFDGTGVGGRRWVGSVPTELEDIWLEHVGTPGSFTYSLTCSPWGGTLRRIQHIR